MAQGILSSSWFAPAAWVVGAVVGLLILLGFAWLILWRWVLSGISPVRRVVHEILGIGQSEKKRQAMESARERRSQRRLARKNMTADRKKET